MNSDSEHPDETLWQEARDRRSERHARFEYTEADVLTAMRAAISGATGAPA